jgi:hypothetical protein
VRAQPEDKQSGPGHQQKAKQTRDSLPPAFAQRAVRPRAVRSTEARVLDRLDGPDRPPREAYTTMDLTAGGERARASSVLLGQWCGPACLRSVLCLQVGLRNRILVVSRTRDVRVRIRSYT